MFTYVIRCVCVCVLTCVDMMIIKLKINFFNYGYLRKLN